MTELLSPLAGTLGALKDVSDPVFASEMLGGGVAIDPTMTTQQVVSPIAGKLLKVHPHAFVVHDGTVGVLVHLGIDTVKLAGDGFTVLAAEKSTVEAGQAVVEWDPSVAVAHQMDPVVLICQMDTAPGPITPEAGRQVVAGEVLFAAV